MDVTLIVMAAGMGSRFGGLKQMEPMDDAGNFLLDYSVYDAKRAGFDSVIFIISVIPLKKQMINRYGSSEFPSVHKVLL